METAFTFSLLPGGIGQLVFNLPHEKVNVLSPPVLEELENLIEQLDPSSGVKLLLITSGKEHQFVAGVDLKKLEPVFQDPSQGEKILALGHRVYKKLSELPFPTIAAIDGACLGGGLELALACKYRIVSDHPKTALGLPETQLGIMPGWGGTQRLPRLIGLSSALGMILNGKTVNGVKAYKMKLADSVAAWEFFPEKSLEFARNILKPEFAQKVLNRRKQSGIQNFLLEKNPAGRALIFYQAKKQVLDKTHGFYPAPLVALETIKQTYTLPLNEGLEIEQKNFVENIPTKFMNAKNLVKVFFQNESLKKDAGISIQATPRPVKSAGVLGAGTMGGGLIFLFSYHDIPVRFKDINWEAVAKGYSHVYSLFKKMIELKKLDKDQAILKFQQASGTIDYTGFKQLDLVVEAATENLELKHTLLNELESQLRPDAIIASNTSSLTIAQMASVMKHPERFVGMHFFNPPNRMPLVEVVKGTQTSDEAIATAVETCRRLGRTPIVVGDCQGFLVNRIFVMGANEIVRFLEKGNSIEKIEKTMLDFGMPMGPFHLSDEVGNDVSCKVSHIFEETYGKRMQVPELIERMNQKGLFGKKTEKGFYLYDSKKPTVNPEVQKIVEVIGQPKEELSSEEMVDRSIFLMINEAARCLTEKIVQKPSDIDMALILGTGFPPFRGGLLRYADSRGIQTVVDRLKEFEQKEGARFSPCELLLEMAKENRNFY
ncbi:MULTISPECIES: 3-hydroxyacyl-CoA dehydrogenase NAD-binding domain-containing protein [Parachlamydia]|uniref:3-hydroxyacyl-CoA dehydrogenase NAD-binding domain-containing protein n=1 Tax=Parachlamydia TaxID=83551 RepID=UPI0007516488|nr:3-hydroxyacyl-CoA dehydrogenase NAD-binding domain-containing protein [Parachlamydia acanthamoebae]